MTTPPDLLALTLLLRPLPAAPPAAPPEWWARAGHRLLLDVARQADPALADRLHNAPGLRPFTVSTLIGRFPHGGLDESGLYRLRFTALQADLAAILLQAAQAGPLAPGAAVELDYHPFQVTAGAAAPAEASYAGLSAALLLSKEPPPRRLALRFLSPTTFKRSGRPEAEEPLLDPEDGPAPPGTPRQARPETPTSRLAMHIPVPLPDLVFGSLLERWNAFAPLSFPPEARRYAAECLALTRYELSTRAIPVKGGALRVGCVGQASYTSLSYDRYWMSLMGVLAAFARFAGVGAGASHGLGQCEAISNF